MVLKTGPDRDYLEGRPVAEREVSSGWLMFIGFRAAEDRILAALAEAGYVDITRAQARLLAGIDLGGTRLVTLADRARIPKQTALALVNGVEAAGYVERVPDPSDGRARLIRLTARGRGVLPLAIAEEARIEADWQALLGVRRMRALRRALWDLALSADPDLHPPEAPERKEA
jgi:DNA-binding MarR family transcriptional regulator